MSSNTPTLYYLVGLPASGKTTYAHQLAKENENTIVLSSDAIRGELYGDESIQGDSNEVFNLLHKRVKENLKNGVNVVYDACNVKSKERRSFVQSLKNIDCWKRCIVMATPYKECIERSKKRERVVPEHVIERMYKKWDTPWYFEGWNHIKIEYASDYKENYSTKSMELFTFDQDNPHHKLSLGEHCWRTGKYLYEHYHNHILAEAGYVHDLSKPFVKARKNSKGEDTDVSHYYCHEHCSGYDALFYEYFDELEQFPETSDDIKYLSDKDVIYISALVCWHMQPYYIEKGNVEKLSRKYKKIWGEDFYRDIMLLHEADKAAH